MNCQNTSDDMPNPDRSIIVVLTPTQSDSWIRDLLRSTCGSPEVITSNSPITIKLQVCGSPKDKASAEHCPEESQSSADFWTDFSTAQTLSKNDMTLGERLDAGLDPWPWPHDPFKGEDL